MNPKTSQAIAELRPGAIPVLDRATQEIAKADILKVYGFAWPEGSDWETGIRELFAFLIRKWEAKR